MSNENFDCALCQGILQTPYECPGCHSNFCQIHINQFRQCPVCNGKYQPSQYKRNVILERMIIEYPFSCTNGCGFKSRNLLELEKHIAQCNPTPLKCIICSYQANEDMLWAHLVEKHKKQIINQFSTSVLKKNNEVYNPVNTDIYDNQTNNVITQQQNYIQTFPNYNQPQILNNNQNIYKTVKEYNFNENTHFGNRTPNKKFQLKNNLYDPYSTIEIHNVNNTQYQGSNANYNTQINYEPYSMQTTQNLNNKAINYRVTMPIQITNVENNIQNQNRDKFYRFPSNVDFSSSKVNFSPGRVMTKIPVNRKRVMLRRVLSPNKGMVMKRVQIL